MSGDGSHDAGRDDGLDEREAEFAGHRPPEQTIAQIQAWAQDVRAEQASVLEALAQ